MTNLSQFAHNFFQINDFISLFNTSKGVQNRLAYMDII